MRSVDSSLDTHARTHARTHEQRIAPQSIAEQTSQRPQPPGLPICHLTACTLGWALQLIDLFARNHARFREKLQAKTDHTAHAPAPRARTQTTHLQTANNCTILESHVESARIPDFAFSNSQLKAINSQLRLQLAFRPSGRPWPALRITPRDSDLSHVISTSRMPPRRLLNIRY